MHVAKIKICSVHAFAEKLCTVTSGMVGATVSFELDSLWDGLAATAVFTAGDVTRDVPCDTAGTVIPWEVLTDPMKTLRCGLYGVNADGDLVIPTTWATIGTIVPGADPSGDPGADPTLPPWVELNRRVDELERGGAGGSVSVSADGDALVITTSMPVSADGDAIVIGG